MTQNEEHAPKLPTLAELIEAGNDPDVYQWMRAKDTNGEDLYLTRIMEDTSEVVYRDGMTVIDVNSEFTPMPDKPKLEWREMPG